MTNGNIGRWQSQTQPTRLVVKNNANSIGFWDVVNNINSHRAGFIAGLNALAYDVTHPIDTMLIPTWHFMDDVERLAFGIDYDNQAALRMSARINSLEQNVEALYTDIRYGNSHTRWSTLGKLTSTLFVGMAGGSVGSVLGEGAETASVLGTGGKAVLKGTESTGLNSRAIAVSHVREARNLLTRVGLTPAQKNEILYSFDLETFRVERIFEPRAEYRLFDDGVAELQGRYVSPHFLENQTDRIVKFALPKNSATRLGIVEISKGSIVFTGRVASQINLAPGLIGGEMQTFLLGPLDQYIFKEILMPRNITNARYSYERY